MKRINLVKFIVAIFLFLSANSFAQGYKWGVSISVSRIALTDNYQVSFWWPTHHVEQLERKLIYWGSGLYYTGAWTIAEVNQIAIKLGVFIAKEPFNGIETGLMYKRIFLDDYKVGLGFNVNIHEFFEWVNGETANTTVDLCVERRIIEETFVGLHLVNQ